MIPLFISAFTVSFAAALAPGPVVAVTLAKSYRSAWAGFKIALGSAVVEIPIILIIYLGLARFLQAELVQLVLGFAGGTVLVILGLTLFRRRNVVISHGKDLPVSAFKLGILTSLVNPGMAIWWATVGALFISNASTFGAVGLVGITLAIELPNFIWYSAISMLFNRYHSIWSSKWQTILMIVFSIALIGFGIWFIFNAVSLVI